MDLPSRRTSKRMQPQSYDYCCQQLYNVTQIFWTPSRRWIHQCWEIPTISEEYDFKLSNKSTCLGIGYSAWQCQTSLAQLIRLWLEEHRVSLLKQPPYSPDTNLMDRYIFRNYECYRRGRNFSNSGEVSKNFRQYLESTSKAKLTEEFQNFTRHLQSVIDAYGDYV